MKAVFDIPVVALIRSPFVYHVLFEQLHIVHRLHVDILVISQDENDIGFARLRRDGDAGDKAQDTKKMKKRLVCLRFRARVVIQ